MDSEVLNIQFVLPSILSFGDHLYRAMLDDLYELVYSCLFIIYITILFDLTQDHIMEFHALPCINLYHYLFEHLFMCYLLFFYEFQFIVDFQVSCYYFFTMFSCYIGMQNSIKVICVLVAL